MKDSMGMFIVSVFDPKYLFLGANLVQKSESVEAKIY